MALMIGVGIFLAAVVVEIPIVLGEGAGAYFEPYPVPGGEHVGSAPQVNPEFGDLARSQPGLRLPVAVSETGPDHAVA